MSEPKVLHSLKAATSLLVVLCGSLYLLSDQVNAVPPSDADRYLAIIAKQEAYIKTLEMAVAVCFDGAGHGPAVPQQASKTQY